MIYIKFVFHAVFVSSPVLCHNIAQFKTARGCYTIKISDVAGTVWDIKTRSVDLDMRHYSACKLMPFLTRMTLFVKFKNVWFGTASRNFSRKLK